MHYLSFLAFPSLPSGSVCRGVGCAEQLFIALCLQGGCCWCGIHLLKSRLSDIGCDLPGVPGIAGREDFTQGIFQW